MHMTFAEFCKRAGAYAMAEGCDPYNSLDAILKLWYEET